MLQFVLSGFAQHLTSHFGLGSARKSSIISKAFGRIGMRINSRFKLAISAKTGYTGFKRKLVYFELHEKQVEIINGPDPTSITD